ncbi:OprD family porin [uncultured Halopseudomonas sp.]|uniref:OprD family porin n=1 Tax=uncultured Halopseudomonas sp. TaxID=2901193 RepID=UPI0030EC4FC5|tara:strand:+ start:26262 stop:27503 length:1242 start_codon:yes stop_codon:yes gene_type:complete
MTNVKTNTLAAAVALALIAPLSSTASAAGFTDDAKASLQLRNFYFNRDFRSTPPGGRSKAEEWAQGFIFRAESGYTTGAVGFGLDVYAATGVKLHSDDDTAGTGLLPNTFGDEGPDSYGHASATAKAKISNSVLRLGNLVPAIPIAQASDIRLLPQTYTGGALSIDEIENLNVQLGQLREVNYRGSTNREDIGATVGGTSDQFNYLGGTYKFTQSDTSLGLWRGELDDVYEQNMINVLQGFTAGDWKMGVNLAYFDTSDTGNQPLNIDHKMKSVLLSAATGAHTFRLGYQHSDGDTAFPYLAENNPYIANYIQILDFARADEKSWQARYDLDFATYGIPGLKGLVRYVSGDNIDLGAAGTGEEWERDIDFVYTIQSGPFKNVALQWRNAMVRSDVAGDIDENRLIVNYTIPLM